MQFAHGSNQEKALLSNFRTIIKNQYEASFSTLNRCIKICPAARWGQPIVNLNHNQVVFHTLFFADLYLQPTFDDSFQAQDFHRRNSAAFRDYEELEDKAQEYQYERDFIEAYLKHCLENARSQLEAATESYLLEPSPFPWTKMTRSEGHIYNIRHIQHHSAQLIMACRMDGDMDFPWYKSGWEDFSPQ